MIKINKILTGIVTILCLIPVFLFAQKPDLVENNQHQAENEFPHPAQYFENFPEVKWRNSFEEVIKLLTDEKISCFYLNESELFWEGYFNQIIGRATLQFEEDGLAKVIIVLFDIKDIESVARMMEDHLIMIYGEPASTDQNDFALFTRWKTLTNFTVEFKKMKDIENPVLSIEWYTL